MSENIKIIQYGVGAMGSNMVRLIQRKPQAHVVGAIDIDLSKQGRDLGEIAGLEHDVGINIQFPPEVVFNQVEADLVLHATTAFMEDAYPQITAILAHKLSVITIAQELFFPLGENVAKAAELDAVAKSMGVRVGATGVNPGFVMDIVPILCTLPCWEVEKVHAHRHVDFSPYGPDEMKHIGAGLDPETFAQGVQQGMIGHIGLLETVGMVAHCLGLQIGELRQAIEPITAQRVRETPFVKILPGKVCGFRQQVVGLRGDEEILNFQMVGLVAPDPEEDGVELGDHTMIYGQPNVNIRIKEEVSQKGGLATAAAAVNMIPRLLAAPPGFHRMYELTLPHMWPGGPSPQPITRIMRS